MENKLKILICDDNIAVHESLSAYFKDENMECVSVFDGAEALDKITNGHFDVIILDIMMPKMFGTDVCREIRKTSDIPIIMLSARGEEFDRILGLELGADDYITKPFSPREVVVRVRTILKRLKPQNASQISQRCIVIGEMTIDVEGYEVKVSDKKLKLTPKETETLIYLAQNRNKVLTREQILNRVWGYDYFGDTRAVDTLVKRLRQKFPASDKGFEIKAIYGVGYKLEVHP
ncbi:putative transcriptional regulatory protein YclJ [Peptoclostridium acidaminophilum DSM 3953]|uniref:Stage 0 sporulation protein A homolog n=1 Tax=Peptoclostridium acidaminophilum DSM 3953 TaxID=1286171 RepID=W8TDY9_PEPAC|nr:response regulator transcription factor [Peptoclostridium acidaminophilum]AHM56038.1 putative transcriptional regulatory protein YclJ [Peptoclostridium acidaminophilum DSM 3953]